MTTSTILPPDPDGQNDERAAWAHTALLAFQNETGTDDEDLLADLLADLLHWCDRHGYSFEDELHRARGMYHDETQDDAPDEKVYATRDDVVGELERLLGSGGSSALAACVYEYMREQGMVQHNGRGFVVERDANVFQIAADLLARDERLLNAAELRAKYAPDSDPDDDNDAYRCEHPRYSRWDWLQAVAQQATILGYWQWVKAQLEKEGD